MEDLLLLLLLSSVQRGLAAYTGSQTAGVGVPTSTMRLVLSHTQGVSRPHILLPPPVRASADRGTLPGPRGGDRLRGHFTGRPLSARAPPTTTVKPLRSRQSAAGPDLESFLRERRWGDPYVAKLIRRLPWPPLRTPRKYILELGLYLGFLFLRPLWIFFSLSFFFGRGFLGDDVRGVLGLIVILSSKSLR